MSKYEYSVFFDIVFIPVSFIVRDAFLNVNKL